MCGDPSCGNSIELHKDVVYTSNKNAFSTTPLNQSHQCPIALNDFNVHNSNQGPTAPNHCNFLPIIDGDASETIVCITAYNEHESTLDKELDSLEHNFSARKRKSVFKISILFHAHGAPRITCTCTI